MTALPDAAARTGLHRLLRHPLVRVLLPLVVVGVAFLALHEFGHSIKISDIRTDLGQVPPRALGLAVLYTALSFAGVAAYDVIAVRRISPGRVPLRLAAGASAGGTAISNLLGFAWITGMAVRYRIYAGLGLQLGEVTAILGTAWIAFWGAALLIAGVVLIAGPVGLATLVPFGRGVEIAVGAGLLALIAAGVAWTATGARALRLWGQDIRLPEARSLAPLLAMGLLDLLGAGLTLWVLLPAAPGLGLPGFLLLFGAAIALGIVSHAPGGIGVFEATIVAGLGAAGRSDVLAALLVYRAVYYLLPFVLTVVTLSVLWLRGQRAAIAGFLGLGHKIAEPAVPPASAALALLVGLMLMVSGSLPAEVGRLHMLRQLLPLQLVEISHLAGSIAGLLLIVLARGLYARLWRAWLMAMALIGVGLLASLTKGLDATEAVTMLLALGLLGSFRQAFYRVEGGPLLRLTPRTLGAVLALVAAAIWIGVVAHGDTAYRTELWWRVAWSGDTSRFLRGSLAIAVVLGGVGVNSLLFARSHKTPAQPIPDTVRRLVADSPKTEANIALLGDKAFLVSDTGRAFLSYADTGRSLIAKGDPVGDPAESRALLRAFREKADREGRRCAFYAVGTDHLPTYLDLGLTIVKIGEVAVVPLGTFTLEGSARKDFRHAMSRATREGIFFEVLPRAELGPLLPELRAVSDAWLDAKSGEEKGFALGAFDEAYILNFDIAVMRRGKGGPILAFANLMRGAARTQQSVDLMRHRPDGPGWVMDALFGNILLRARAEGYATFSLGAAPFAGLSGGRLAPLWSRVGALVYQHGERFYHFEGLRAWKQKFDPVWEPNYLACPGGFAAPAILYEVNVLISGGVRGLLK